MDIISVSHCLHNVYISIPFTSPALATDLRFLSANSSEDAKVAFS